MADVAATLAGWLSTSASNGPSGATTIGTGLDDNIREIQGVIVRGLSHKGSDIASVAGTTDIGAVEGLMHDITGALAITGLGTVRSGILKVLKFEGAGLSPITQRLSFSLARRTSPVPMGMWGSSSPRVLETGDAFTT
jgi:hypothetical protein